MNFYSILFEKVEDRKQEILEVPDFFVDLNLDQIIDDITCKWQQYNLKPFFYTNLDKVDTIEYRHEIMQDLENKNLFEYINLFAKSMVKMREYLECSNKLHYKYQKERWFLDAVEVYCDAINCLINNLKLADLKSRGFLAFREFVDGYSKSDGFISLFNDAKKLKADLSTIKYCMLIKGNCIKVQKYESQLDYSADVEETFKKFKQGAVKDYRVKFSTSQEMNHVEAEVLNLVAQLYSDIFSNLDVFCTENSNYLNETIATFDREIHFYIAYMEYISILKHTGLKFCYPEISDKNKEVYVYEGFDLALADKLTAKDIPVVCNDFYLKNNERIFVVSGPNQGGKTTFARTFGQMHYLASIGCQVPGREAKLFLFDRIFTHFEKEEDIKNLSGKLQEDLVRMKSILNQATSNSIIIMNEIFSSTTLKDAVYLGKKVMDKISRLDSLCVCVTFICELASLNEKTVSMVSTVVPGSPALRTYKIIRMPADGLSYAVSIAQKYNLTYDCIKERIR